MSKHINRENLPSRFRFLSCFDALLLNSLVEVSALSRTISVNCSFKFISKINGISFNYFKGSLSVSSVFVIITVFGLQLPHVFRRCFRIVDGNLTQCLFEKGHGLFGDFAQIFERVVLNNLDIEENNTLASKQNIININKH